MRTTFFALALLALLGTGCSTAVSPEKSARIDPKKTGLVLVTVTRTGTTKDAPYVLVELMLRPVDHRDTALKNPSIDCMKGMSLIEVPPGRYTISDYHVADDAAAIGTETARRGFEFDVAPGQVTYIGHFDVAVTTGKIDVESRQWLPAHAQPVLRDRYDESVAAFRQQYPTLAAVPVVDVAPRELVLTADKASGPSYGRGNLGMTDYGFGVPMATAPKWP